MSRCSASEDIPQTLHISGFIAVFTRLCNLPLSWVMNTVKTILTYFHTKHFNINLPHSHRPLYWLLSFKFPYQNTVQESPPLWMPQSPPTLPSFILIILIFGNTHYQAPHYAPFLQFPAISSVFSSNTVQIPVLKLPPSVSGRCTFKS